MDRIKQVFLYNYPNGETRQGANAAVRIDVLNEDKSMAGPFIDTYWHGMLKTPQIGVVSCGPTDKQFLLSDNTVEVVDIDLTKLPSGTRFLRLYVYNLYPHRDGVE